MDSLLRHDLAAIRQLEADDALLVDLAGGSYDPPAPNAIRYGMVDGLEQTQYPVSFVDEVQWTAADGHNVIDLIVITRADAASTWKISLEAPFPGDCCPGVLTPDGHVPFHTPLEPMSNATAQAYPAAMAAYWQSWADRGGPPDETPFVNAGALTEIGENIAEGRRDMKARGETRTTRYVPGPKSYAFAVDATQHAAVQLGALGEHDHADRRPHDLPTGRPDRVRASPRPRRVPGGSVHSLGLRQTCFITARAGPGVLGQAGGQYEASGTPAG